MTGISDRAAFRRARDTDQGSWFARNLTTMRIPPRRFATAILAVFVIMYGALAIQGVAAETRSVGQALLSGFFVVFLLSLQLGYFSRPAVRPQAPGKYLALLAYAAGVFAPIMLFGPVWRGFPGMLAGNALLVLPLSAGIPVFLIIVVTLAGVSIAGNPVMETSGFVITSTYVATSILTAGIALYGLSTLVRLVIEAQEARDELRRAVIARERVRFARNLHDLLGESLSAIALRGELVARLMGDQTERARAELADVLALARKALADGRLVVTVRRELTPEVRAPRTASHMPAAALRPRLSVALLLVVMADYGVNAVINVAEDRGAGPAFVTALIRIAEAGIVLHLTQNRHALSPVRRGLTLLAFATLVWAPALYIGPYGLGAEGQLMGVALAVLPPAAGITVFVLAWAGSVGIVTLMPLEGISAFDAYGYTLISMVVVALTVYGLATISRLVTEVRAARSDVGAVAAAQERVRFARDVHDLLGFGLSAVALKTELVGKLIGREPERAKVELDELLETTHRALSDVRSLVGGEHDLSLADELEEVDATLTAADVRVDVRRPATVPGGAVGSVLATVLREAATNVLRHSKAQWCDVEFEARANCYTLSVTNDGVGAGRVGPAEGGGNGLRNMAERVEAVGGALRSSMDDGVFRLVVTAPVAPSKAHRGWSARFEPRLSRTS